MLIGGASSVLNLSYVCIRFSSSRDGLTMEVDADPP